MPDTDKNEAQEMVSHLTGWSTTPKKLSPQNEDAQLKIFQTFFFFGVVPPLSLKIGDDSFVIYSSIFYTDG